MEKYYKRFKVQRIFKEDTELIKKCYSEYDFLHFNPISDEFIVKVMIEGSFWEILDGETPVALTYMLPFESDAVPEYAKWEILDLLDIDKKYSLLCGYTWINKDYKDRECTDALANLWSIKGYKSHAKHIIHYMPAHVEIDFASLFKNGFNLVGLRGLDKLVPHYIFMKTEKEKEVPLTDTKQISKLCEQGYKGYGITTDKNILFRG